MIAWLLAGCLAPPEAVEMPLGDPALFAEAAQPVLASCANPACHGDPGRPLEVYAEHLHRLDPDDTWRDLPLTSEEVWLNQCRASAFVVALDDPEDSEILTKPLAPEAGGVAHGGGTWFSDPANPDYQALLSWIDTAWRAP